MTDQRLTYAHELASGQPGPAAMAWACGAFAEFMAGEDLYRAFGVDAGLPAEYRRHQWLTHIADALDCINQPGRTPYSLSRELSAEITRQKRFIRQRVLTTDFERHIHKALQADPDCITSADSLRKVVSKILESAT